MPSPTAQTIENTGYCNPKGNWYEMGPRECTLFERNFSKAKITDIFPDNRNREGNIDFEFEEEKSQLVHDFIFNKAYYDLQIKKAAKGSKIAARRIALMVKIMMIYGVSLDAG